MKNMVQQVLLFCVLICISFTNGILQTPPVSGFAKYSLVLDGTNYIQTSPNLPNEIMESFSFEMWIYVNQAVSGKYQPIIAHQSTPNQANKAVDFVVQVKPDGILHFFMGNGLSAPNSGFGFSLSSPSPVPSQKWFHVAISVGMSQLTPNLPLDSALYINGERIATGVWNGFNSYRQFSISPVIVGRLDNNEPGVQSFKGKIDELKFWKGYRHAPQIKEQMNLRSDATEVDLISYFRFDNPNNFDLILDAVSGQTVSQTTTLKFDISEFSLGTKVVLNLSDASSIKEIYLPAFDINGDQIDIEILSLPSSESGKIYAKNGQGHFVTTIKNAPFNLLSPFIGYTFDAHFTNFVDIIEYTTRDSHSYSAIRSFVKIYVISNPTCDGVPNHVIDNCGVCGGENKDCECPNELGYFRSYKLGDLDQILAWSASHASKDLLVEAQGKLLETTLFLDQADYNQLSLGDYIPILHNFEENCLSNWLDQVEILKEFDQSQN